MSPHCLLRSVVEEYMLYVGGSIGYWQGDVKKLMDDLAALKPTLFVGVPRVFERICGGINDLVSSASSALLWVRCAALWMVGVPFWIDELVFQALQSCSTSAYARKHSESGSLR